MLQPYTPLPCLSTYITKLPKHLDFSFTFIDKMEPMDFRLDFAKIAKLEDTIFKHIEFESFNMPNIMEMNPSGTGINSNSPSWMIHKFRNKENRRDQYRHFYESFKIPKEDYEKIRAEFGEKFKEYFDSFGAKKEEEKTESKRRTEFQKMKELYLEWDRIIQEAVERSPGFQLANLSDEERNRILEEEWLVKDPLTGICTGLAIDFLLHAELDPEFSEMQPSENARYFEKLLIPAMVTILKKNGLESPSELTTLKHYDEIYLEMKRVISLKSNLHAEFIVQHHSMHDLSEAIVNLEGHQLLFLERKEREVAANHCVYFNPTNRIIADGGSGVVIKVPETDSFAKFFEYYMNETYRDEYELFSIASVKKDENARSIRFPSSWDKLQLKGTLFSYQMQTYLIQEALSFGEGYKKGVEEIPAQFKTFAMIMPKA